MKSFVSQVRTAARKRRAYMRTLSELRQLPQDTRRDLDLGTDELRSIAHRAVYGA